MVNVLIPLFILYNFTHIVDTAKFCARAPLVYDFGKTNLKNINQMQPLAVV